MFHFTYRFIVNFSISIILFSSREADGIPKMFSYEFCLHPSVCEDGRDFGTAQQRSFF